MLILTTKLKLLSSWSTLALFIILLNNAFISNLTPTSAHNEPYTLRGRTATAPTSAFICCFRSQRRGEGRIFHLLCWDAEFGIRYRYTEISVFLSSVSVFIPIFSKSRYTDTDIFKPEIAHAYLHPLHHQLWQLPKRRRGYEYVSPTFQNSSRRFQNFQPIKLEKESLLCQHNRTSSRAWLTITTHHPLSMLPAPTRESTTTLRIVCHQNRRS